MRNIILKRLIHSKIVFSEYFGKNSLCLGTKIQPSNECSLNKIGTSSYSAECIFSKKCFV